ncbi:MAG: hypothetical protein ACREP7_06900 [Lysobacter sp.]
MDSEDAMVRAQALAVRRTLAHRRDGAERWVAAGVVIALHAALFWFGGRLLAPPPQALDRAEDMVLVLLSPPPRAQQPDEPVVAVRRSATTATTLPRTTPRRDPSPAPSPRLSESVAPPPADPAPSEGLTAIRIDRSTLDPAPPTPWDPPTSKAFASRKPSLPGQGAQRFKMQPPRSIASTVEQIGRMFGGGGPSDCDETRENIRDLAVLGAEAVAQELREERRNCRR